MKLHIAIPTFNRSQKLASQLQRLTIAQRKCGYKFHVSIHDNSSTDDTAQISNEYIVQGLRAEYNINTFNMGAALNIRQCVLHCKGDYLWILADDDPVDVDELVNAVDHAPSCKSLVIFNPQVEGRENGYLPFHVIEAWNQQDALSIYKNILQYEPVLSYWISSFWICKESALKTLSSPVFTGNMMFPLLLSGMAALNGNVEVSRYSLVKHHLANDHWSKDWGKLVMWTDKKEVALELIRQGMPLDVFLNSNFIESISFKSLISLCLRYPKHAVRSISSNIMWKQIIPH